MKPLHRKLATLLSGTADGQPVMVEGGFLWMPRPEIAPAAYRHRVYDGLNADGLRQVEGRYGARANKYALEWLSAANGARLFDGALILKGLVASEKRDPTSPLGQPISLDFGNLLGNPTFASADHFIAGTFIFEDDLLPIILDSNGEVAVFEDGAELERWDSIWDFIADSGKWIVTHQSPKSRR
ncbi:hypothetical protein [Brevundimonas sp. SL130]|uniref:hypothetical protein n=1 Tax=Brevundimonas sp. SL130 TaxID=2995143 RepID=UPI00226C790A|nr:hypothetical protein [Brevundimonas sp. SL130]WAC59782.1 hypothetical protein OU998_16495 [Brevundimonas sp. SL130]